MHAGTKKRTGWNPRRGSSPFVRKNAKQIGIFQKTARKNGRNLSKSPVSRAVRFELRIMAGAEGIEPSAYGFGDRRSTG